MNNPWRIQAEREAAENYKSVEPAAAKKKLVDLASGINYALETRSNDNSNKELSDSINKFCEFFKGTPLASYAERYYLELLKNKDDNDLAAHNFQMLSALIDENYEDAAKLRDKIRNNSYQLSS